MIKKYPIIRVIGIGNILAGNDGVGIRVIHQLENMRNTNNILKKIEILDLGACGLDLLLYLEDADFVILIDAVKINQKFGTVIKISGEKLLNKDINLSISSLHDITLKETLTIAKEIQKLPKITLFGVSINSNNKHSNIIDLTLNLDEEIEISIDKVVLLVINEINLFIKNNDR